MNRNRFSHWNRNCPSISGEGRRLLSKLRVTESNYQRIADKLRRNTRTAPKIESLVRRVIDHVERDGDRALLVYTRKFDGIALSRKDIKVPKARIANSLGRVDKRVLSAIRLSLERLRSSQRKLVSRLNYQAQIGGFSIKVEPRPIESVGCYVPGGKATYPSTVIMTAGLAKLAGVERVVVCTPPDANGSIPDVVLAAAHLCKVENVYQVGGAQAIAALAYGTETIPKVDKIVGPGGTFVTVAKRLVSTNVPIDFLAGPTELVVVADRSISPKLVAWDLIAQGEHGGETVSCLVTCDPYVAKSVDDALRRILPTIERREHVQSSLNKGFTAICDSVPVACKFVNAIAPEHVELLLEDAERWSRKIRNAGLILVGPYAPSTVTDYLAGTDHVLPTGGGAKIRGGLTILDFVRLSCIVRGSPRALKSQVNAMKALTAIEHLPNHYRSVTARFRGT